MTAIVTGEPVADEELALDELPPEELPLVEFPFDELLLLPQAATAKAATAAASSITTVRRRRTFILSSSLECPPLFRPLPARASDHSSIFIQTSDRSQPPIKRLTEIYGELLIGKIVRCLLRFRRPATSRRDEVLEEAGVTRRPGRVVRPAAGSSIEPVEEALDARGYLTWSRPRL
jgi:hypothetical protein